MYESKWGLFVAFCDDRGADLLPASVEIVAAYLSNRAEEVTLSTIRQDVAAIRWMHERCGADDPTDGAGVTRMLDGINQKSSPDDGRGEKQAVLTKHVRGMVNTRFRWTRQGRTPAPRARTTYLRAPRNRALILAGFACAFRRAELARIEADRVTLNADPRTTAGYVEDARRMETNTSRDLGL